jgi:hypothetical protein
MATKPATRGRPKKADDGRYSQARLDKMGSVRTEKNTRVQAAQVGQTPDNRFELDRMDSFDFLSPLQQMPNTPSYQRDIIMACMNAYYRCGILRNVIDIMSNFGSQGIHIIHPNKKKEDFYRYWFKKVKGKERSERFLNMLYKAGNVVVKRDIAKLNKKDLDDFRRTVASGGPDSKYVRLTKVGKNELPIKYHILDPWLLETVGGDLAPFLSEKIYVLRIPTTLIQMVQCQGMPSYQEMVAMLPDFIKDAINKGQYFIPLDQDKLAIYHYMKDDSLTWAYPLTYSILDDIMLLQNMKRADDAALRGMISHIRVWLLGNVDKGIVPGKEAFEKLEACLSSDFHGSTMDLIWDDCIKLIETSTDAYKFLGPEKYQSPLSAIFGGLGIPASLTGSSTDEGGFGNNAISLKTLIERLQYGRDHLVDFWQNEIRLVKEAIGDKEDAEVMFDNMNLYEEANEKMIWVQLLDRNVISMASMQERFGLSPEVEAQRMKRETASRSKTKMPAKAGPFHNDALHTNNVTNTALVQGTISPSEAGVKKKPKPRGEKSLLDHQKEIQTLSSPSPEGPKKQPQQGRPKNSTDKTKRKKKTVKPSTKADGVD